MPKFNFDEWQSIAFDCRTAAAQYQKDADECSAAGHERLAEQFRKQVATSQAFAERIEQEAE